MLELAEQTTKKYNARATKFGQQRMKVTLSDSPRYEIGILGRPCLSFETSELSDK
jgi:hypothetical protein